MNIISAGASFLKDVGVYITVLSPLVLFFIAIVIGVKCLLRSEILKIYYHNKDTKKLRQYEAENLALLYKAYRLMFGNTFIKDIYEEMSNWEVET